MIPFADWLSSCLFVNINDENYLLVQENSQSVIVRWSASEIISISSFIRHQHSCRSSTLSSLISRVLLWLSRKLCCECVHEFFLRWEKSYWFRYRSCSRDNLVSLIHIFWSFFWAMTACSSAAMSLMSAWLEERPDCHRATSSLRDLNSSLKRWADAAESDRAFPTVLN